MMLDKDGQRIVTVQKAELLGVLRENRVKHHREWEEAHLAWHAAVVRELESMLAKARAGTLRATCHGQLEPADHSGEYDSAIRMLEMSVHDLAHLDPQLFNQYVLDDWNWTANFKISTARYSGDGGAR